jgi:hypothetical protein
MGANLMRNSALAREVASFAKSISDSIEGLPRTDCVALIIAKARFADKLFGETVWTKVEVGQVSHHVAVWSCTTRRKIHGVVGMSQERNTKIRRSVRKGEKDNSG